jgi:heat shock protein 4
MKSRTELPRRFFSARQWKKSTNISSLISYTARQRYIGEAAKTAETSNFKNTIGSLKRLVGRSLADPEIEEFEKQFINAQLVDVDGEVGVKVSHPFAS